MQMLHEKLYKLDHERNCEVEDLKKKVVCLYIILYIIFILFHFENSIFFSFSSSIVINI